jgi:hypothetical protein
VGEQLIQIRENLSEISVFLKKELEIRLLFIEILIKCSKDTQASKIENF